MTFVEQPAERTDPAVLVKRIQGGDRTGEDELVHRYSRGIAIIIRRVARDPSTTEDLCQETFRLVLEKVRRGDVREPEKLSGFICSLARNLAIAHVRRPQPLQPLEEEKESESFSSQLAGPLDTLLEKEKVQAVRQVISELTTGRDREILHRFYLLEEDKERVCADLDLSSLHFNRVLHRARERFRELYEQNIRKKAV